MQHILPEFDFLTSAYFTTLDVSSVWYMSLVVKGEVPGDDLYLNGTSLGNLTWSLANGYSTAEMEITQGAYELESVNYRPFSVYIYYHMDWRLKCWWCWLFFAANSVLSNHNYPNNTNTTTYYTTTHTNNTESLREHHLHRNTQPESMEQDSQPTARDISPICVMVSINKYIQAEKVFQSLEGENYCT